MAPARPSLGSIDLLGTLTDMLYSRARILLLAASLLGPFHEGAHVLFRREYPVPFITQQPSHQPQRQRVSLLVCAAVDQFAACRLAVHSHIIILRLWHSLSVRPLIKVQCVYDVVFRFDYSAARRAAAQSFQ